MISVLTREMLGKKTKCLPTFNICFIFCQSCYWLLTFHSPLLAVKIPKIHVKTCQLGKNSFKRRIKTFFPCKVSMFSFYFFFKSFATHSTQSSMLSVSFLGKGKGMMTSGGMPRPSLEKSFSKKPESTVVA